MDMDVENMHVINAAEIKNIAGEIMFYFLFSIFIIKLFFIQY